MAIDQKLIAELMKGYKKPEYMVGENGLLKQITKAVLEAAMQVEMQEHLGYEKHDPAVTNINEHSDKLTGTQTKILGNVKTIDVDASAKRSYSKRSKGQFTLMPGYVDQSSRAFLGSAIGHDAFHMEQFLTRGISNSRGVQAEKGVFVFQLDFGQKIGIAPYEADYLKGLISDPEKLKSYYDSPVM